MAGDASALPVINSSATAWRLDCAERRRLGIILLCSPSLPGRAEALSACDPPMPIYKCLYKKWCIAGFLMRIGNLVAAETLIITLSFKKCAFVKIF
jgi:hypothetical protein